MKEGETEKKKESEGEIKSDSNNGLNKACVGFVFREKTH